MLKYSVCFCFVQQFFRVFQRKLGYLVAADYPSLIYHARCRSLRIECVKESVVNIDGEAAYTTDAKIELIPQAIRFFYPKGLTYHTKNSQSGHKFAEITP